jgi:hypothetical protein
VRGGEGTGYATMSMKEEYLIPPDDARRLNVGECYVIAQGSGYKVHVAAIQTDTASLADAEAYIGEQARSINATAKRPTPSLKERETPPTAPGSEKHRNPTQTNDDQQQRGTDDPDLL